jgi:hypothetical protein
MTTSSSDYAVGRGKPPLHSRFQKGQSGNPSGRPGPAKLAKQRFQRALWAALEERPEDLEGSRPASILAAIARKMALDASDGRSAAVRQVLSQMETGSVRSAGMDDDTAEQLFTGAELLSLLQGTMQGNEKQWLEDLLWPQAQDGAAPANDTAPKKEIAAPAPTAALPPRNKQEPLSLLQGKKQGNGIKMPEQIWSPAPAPAAARAQFMTGTAPIIFPSRELQSTTRNHHLPPAGRSKFASAAQRISGGG